MEMSLISFKDLFVSFNGTELFSGFNCEIPRGEKVCFASSSDRGKTALFRLLLGFLRPDSGEIIIDGVPISASTVAEVRKKATYLSHDVDFQEGSVEDVIGEILNFHYNREMRISLEKVKLEAERLQLQDDIWSRQITGLSGGERQRLGLSLCLALRREILLLDEPTLSLEWDMKKYVCETILESDKTVLILSHDDIWQSENIRTVTW